MRDGRDASDVDGAVEAGDDAREKLKGQLGEGAACGGGGGGGGGGRGGGGGGGGEASVGADISGKRICASWVATRPPTGARIEKARKRIRPTSEIMTCPAL